MYHQKENCKSNAIAPFPDLSRTPNFPKVLSVPKAGCCVFRVLLRQTDPPKRKAFCCMIYMLSTASPRNKDLHLTLHRLPTVYPTLSHLFRVVSLLWRWIGGEILAGHIKVVLQIKGSTHLNHQVSSGKGAFRRPFRPQTSTTRPSLKSQDIPNRPCCKASSSDEISDGVGQNIR